MKFRSGLSVKHQSSPSFKLVFTSMGFLRKNVFVDF